MTSAETAYLFRHALLRDAAYELQLPTERARLHELAFHLIEQAFGGRCPALPPLDSRETIPWQAHPTDAVAQELAEHGAIAVAHGARSELPALVQLYLRRAAHYAEHMFRSDLAATHWQKLAALVDGTLRGIALRAAADSWGDGGRGDLALKVATESLTVLRHSGDEFESANTLGAIGNIHLQTGRASEALTAMLESLEAHRRSGDMRGEGRQLSNIGLIHNQLGEYDKAESKYRQALTIHRKVGNRRSEGYTLDSLAVVYQNTARNEQAEQALEQALAIHRETGDRRREGVALGNLGVLYVETSRADDARCIYEQALAIHRETGNRRSEGIVLTNLASLCQEVGDLAQAESFARRALPLLQEVGSPARTATMTVLANINVDRGLYDSAESTYLEALELAVSTRNRQLEGVVRGAIGALYGLTSRFEEARRCFDEALSIARQSGDRNNEGAHLCGLALVCLRSGRPDEAKAFWLQGRQHLHELNDTGQLQEASAGMRKACVEAGVEPFE